MALSEMTTIFVLFHTMRGRQHPTPKVFQDLAQRGKSSMGWFYGFKLHAVINHQVGVVHSEFDQALLRKRTLVETVFDEFKKLCQIEHTRHRSLSNFAVNLMAGIVAYCLQPVKPRIAEQDSRVPLGVK